ncbi:hypothetical protein ACT4WO_19900 (plasmid) [Acinetobacter baumannii]
MIDQPTPQNARELYNILHDLNYSFKAVEEGKKNKELFGLSYDTFNAWLADPKCLHDTEIQNCKLGKVSFMKLLQRKEVLETSMQWY